MNVKCHCPNYKITHIQILYIISSHKKKKNTQNVWLKQKISKLHIANNTAFSLFYIPLFSCSSHATFRYRRKNSSFFVLIFITDVCQSEVSIAKILKCSNCLSVMLHSLSKHLIFKVGRAKTLAFPTSLLCFHWQFKENRNSLWLFIQSLQKTCTPATFRIYMQLFHHVHDALSYMI